MLRTNYFFLKFCWLSFLWLAPLFVFAQNTTGLSFEKVQGEELTNYYIKCIQQDKKGFLWFGTNEGIFKYDGYAFKAFKNYADDPHSLVNAEYGAGNIR
jgi:ligand-binding sensor domain-containing protein